MRKGFVEVRLNCIDCLHHVLGGRIVDYHINGETNRNDEKYEDVEDNAEDGEYVQPLEAGQAIQAECKPPLVVSNLLELGV